MDNNTPPANAVTDFAAWLTMRDEVSGPFSAQHEVYPMAQLVEEYLQLRGLEFSEEYAESERADREYTAQTNMTPMDHVAWFFHDVMCSWAGPDIWMRYASACAEFPPPEHQLPKDFRDAWLRLVSKWKGR